MTKIKPTAKQKRLLLGVVVGMLLVASVLVLMKSAPFMRDDKPDFLPTDSMSETDAMDMLQVKAQLSAEKGDVDEGLRLFDEEIKQSNGNEKKQKLLVSKSYFAFDNEHFDEALEAAELADEIDSSKGTWLLLARMHTSKGNREVAVDYYQKVLDAIDSDSDPRNERQELQWVIEELRS